MKEILEAFAAAQGWVFDYGRSDFHNLKDVAEQTEVTHLFLDPVEIGKNRNDSGGVDSISYSGSFMLMYSSDIDEESYDFRYENYIKPIISGQIELLEDDLICTHEANIEQWKIVEVINVFDYNLDGVLVTYKVTIDE